MKTICLLICLCFNFISDISCGGKAQDSSLGNNSNHNGQLHNTNEEQKAEIVYLKISCTDDEKCIVIAYCHPNLFNQNGMEKIARKLSDKFTKKKVVNVNLFDKKDLAKAYAKGIRSLGDIQNERRGWYLRTDEREFLLFFPDPADRSKHLSISLRS